MVGRFNLSACSQSQGYSLQLANGLGWSLMADEAAQNWLDKLAMIMRLPLEPLNGQPRIYIRRGNLTRRDGWQTTDLDLLKLWTCPELSDVICELAENPTGQDNRVLDIIRMFRLLAVVAEKVLESGGLFLHAALVERDGRGYVLAGHGGAGKSTACRRIPGPWRALCDDEVLIVRDNNGRFLAHPFPTWSEHLEQPSELSWPTSYAVPLAGVFFLEQAEKDGLTPLKQAQAAINLKVSAEQTCQRYRQKLAPAKQQAMITSVFSNACDLARKIPASTLRASLNGRFWQEMEKVV